MAHKKGMTIAQIEHALRQKDGNITETAGALGVTRQAIHLRIQKSKVLEQVVIDARESLVDVAESALSRQIKQGNTAAIIFTLKTLGKSRGYVERQELTGAQGDPLHTITYIKEIRPESDE